MLSKLKRDVDAGFAKIKKYVEISSKGNGARIELVLTYGRDAEKLSIEELKQRIEHVKCVIFHICNKCTVFFLDPEALHFPVKKILEEVEAEAYDKDINRAGLQKALLFDLVVRKFIDGTGQNLDYQLLKSCRIPGVGLSCII